MSIRRPSRFHAARRRRALAFRAAGQLDQQLEGRWAAVPLGATALAIAAVPALGQAASMHAIGGGE